MLDDPAAAPAPDPAPADAVALVGPWRQFRRYWYGHLASFAGDWFTILALPLAALSINRSPLFVGVVEFSELVATFLVGMRLGALADRLPPRRVMITADLIRTGLIGALAVAFLVGQPPAVLLVLVAFSLGAMRDLHDGGEGVMMASVVPEDLLVRANSRFQISDGLGHMAGSLLGGVAATISLALAFGVDAASYLLAAAAVLSMGHVAVPDPSPAEGETDDPTDDPTDGPEPPWREALAAVRTENRYWRVLVTMCVTNVATVCFMGQFVTFGSRELRLANWQIGVTMSVMGLGSFLAGLALDRIGSISPRTILVAPLVIGTVPVLAAATSSWAVTLVGFVAVGAVLALGGALVGAMRHASFPATLQGRVAMGSRLGFSFGVIPGVLIGGWLAAAAGTATMFTVFGLIGLAGAIVGLGLGVTGLHTLTGSDEQPESAQIDLTEPSDADLVDLRTGPQPADTARPPVDSLSDEAALRILAHALSALDHRDRPTTWR